MNLRYNHEYINLETKKLRIKLLNAIKQKNFYPCFTHSLLLL